MHVRSVLVAVLVLLAGCRTPMVEGRRVCVAHGAVVSVDRHASRIGAAVLRDGGNAVDAAVAVALALAVTWPQAGNLGGGGFMLVSMADGRRCAIDYRETAPSVARPDMFLDASGEVDPVKVRLGRRPVGVPGTVRGLELALRRYGTKSFAELARPAIRLARDGFLVDDDLAKALKRHADELTRDPQALRIFYHQDGTPPDVGERLIQPDLADTLEILVREGPDSFYEGTVARLLADDMQRHGGLITLEDLRQYRAVARSPLRAVHEDYEVLGMPLPSSGGVALAQVLGMLEPFDLGRTDPRGARFYHLVAEALRRAFAERAAYLGDSDFVDVPLDYLTSPAHLAELGASIRVNRASSSVEFGPPLLPGPEHGSTTHFSVVDASGNAVANTFTLEEIFGAKVVAEGTGILLNNELHDFNVRPGETSARGRIGTDANLVAPGKRPLSSMSPTIVRRDGQVVLVTGSPGGRTIISTVTGMVLRVVECGMDLGDAMEAPRIHHQWYPDELRIEESLPAPIRGELEALGHRLRVVERQGDAHSIFVESRGGWRHAVADERIDGWAVGY